MRSTRRTASSLSTPLSLRVRVFRVHVHIFSNYILGLEVFLYRYFKAEVIVYQSHTEVWGLGVLGGSGFRVQGLGFVQDLVFG